jgi:hypothetical protein
MDNIEFRSFVMILDLMIWSPVIVGLILLLIGEKCHITFLLVIVNNIIACICYEYVCFINV